MTQPKVKPIEITILKSQVENMRVSCQHAHDVIGVMRKEMDAMRRELRRLADRIERDSE